MYTVKPSVCDYPKCEDEVITTGGGRLRRESEHGGSFAIRGLDTSTL